MALKYLLDKNIIKKLLHVQCLQNDMWYLELNKKKPLSLSKHILFVQWRYDTIFSLKQQIVYKNFILDLVNWLVLQTRINFLDQNNLKIHLSFDKLCRVIYTMYVQKMCTDNIFFRAFKPCMGKKEVPVMISRYSHFDKECQDVI